MTDDPLSSHQRAALERMRPGQWYRPGDVPAAWQTLKSLVRLGLLEAWYEGTSLYPASHKIYRKLPPEARRDAE